MLYDGQYLVLVTKKEMHTYLGSTNKNISTADMTKANLVVAGIVLRRVNRLLWR